MRKHTVEVTETELRAILTAFDYASADTKHAQWAETELVRRLYKRLRDHGLGVPA
jgi:hypothetical protein